MPGFPDVKICAKFGPNMLDGASACRDSNKHECFPDNDAFVKVRYCVDEDRTLPKTAIQPDCPITDIEIISGSITTDPRQNWEERIYVATTFVTRIWPSEGFEY